jgi:hypothetical protein
MVGWLVSSWNSQLGSTQMAVVGWSVNRLMSKCFRYKHGSLLHVYVVNPIFSSSNSTLHVIFFMTISWYDVKNVKIAIKSLIAPYLQIIGRFSFSKSPHVLHNLNQSSNYSASTT